MMKYQKNHEAVHEAHHTQIWQRPRIAHRESPGSLIRRVSKFECSHGRWSSSCWCHTLEAHHLSLGEVAEILESTLKFDQWLLVSTEVSRPWSDEGYYELSLFLVSVARRARSSRWFCFQANLDANWTNVDLSRRSRNWRFRIRRGRRYILLSVPVWR